MTDRNYKLIQSLIGWIMDLQEHLEDENDVMFLHLDLNVLNGECITNIKVAKNDRKLQRSKQKTA